MLPKAIKYLLAILLIGFIYSVLSTSTAKAEEITVQVTPASDAVLSQMDTVTVTSVTTKVKLATTMLQATVDSATATVALTPNAQVLVESKPEVKEAVIKAGNDINNATQSISNAVVALAVVESATATVAIEQAQTQVAIAAVDSATATVAVVTQDVTNTQTALTTAQEAQPALDATAACAPGSHCVDFYNKNAELGPLHDQIAPAQAAADAAVVAVPVAQATVKSATTTVATTQSAVDAAIVASNKAKAAAESSAVTVTTNGVKASAYTYNGGNAPAIPTENVIPVLTTTVPYISANWGNGTVLGVRSDRVIIKYEGTITVPEEAVAVKYAVYSDDGSKLYIDGQLAINNWKDQGSTWSQFSPIYDTTVDKQQDFILWYYENGGGANVTLGWGITRADGTGYWTNPMNTAFATTVVTKDPLLVAAANAASATFVTANQQLTTAKASLTTATQTLATAQAAVPVTSQAVVDAQSAYDTKLAERNAAYQSWQDAVHAANVGLGTIAAAQVAYETSQQNLTLAQQNLTVAQENLTKQQVKEQTAQAAATVAIATANQLSDTATVAVQNAVKSLENAVSSVQKAYLDSQAVIPTPAPIPSPTPQPAPDPTPQPVPSQPEPPVANPEPLPTPSDPLPEPTPEPEPKPEPQPDPQPVPEPAPDPQPQPAPDPSHNQHQTHSHNQSQPQHHSQTQHLLLNPFHNPNHLHSLHQNLLLKQLCLD